MHVGDGKGPCRGVQLVLLLRHRIVDEEEPAVFDAIELTLHSVDRARAEADAAENRGRGGEAVEAAATPEWILEAEAQSP